MTAVFRRWRKIGVNSNKYDLHNERIIPFSEALNILRRKSFLPCGLISGSSYNRGFSNMSVGSAA